MKKLSQEEFDRLMIFELIPDLKEDYGDINYIVLTKKGKFQFAKECQECHDVILIEKEYDMATEITKTIGDDPKSYLEILTELDVVTLYEIDECECFDHEVDPEEDYIVADDDEFYESEMLKEDSYDDMDDY